MAFLSSCKTLSATLSAEDPYKVILEFLLAEAVGRKNAKSWPRIEDHLSAAGVTNAPSKEAFQVDFLGLTRRGEEFIGSSNKGYYIIADAGDAEATRRFYQHRIFTEMDRLRRLEALIEKEFPLD